MVHTEVWETILAVQRAFGKQCMENQILPPSQGLRFKIVEQCL